MKVDPGGLASAAQRIVAALGQLPAGDQVHPALGADPASLGAALRLSTGATTLSALIAAQSTGLAVTAEVLAGVGAGFDAVEAANAANLSTLSGFASAAPVTGFAPPPAQAPDIRPPMPPPAAVLGEATSRAVHTGDVSAGEGFRSGWSRVADAVDDAADVVARVADNLPARCPARWCALTCRATAARWPMRGHGPPDWRVRPGATPTTRHRPGSTYPLRRSTAI
jgi:hypothetical protein